MCRKELKWTGGYLTVEASIIIPLAVFLTGFIFYLTFYLYNRCIVSQDTYMLAFRGGACGYCGSGRSGVYGCGKSAEEIERLIIGQCDEQFGEKYMGINKLISTVQVDKKSVVVEASGMMTTAFTGQLLPQRHWDFYARGQAERICPAEYIRKVRLAKKIADRVNGHTEME